MTLHEMPKGVMHRMPDKEVMEARTELQAMKRVLAAIEPLNPRERRRVLRFISDRIREEERCED